MDAASPVQQDTGGPLPRAAPDNPRPFLLMFGVLFGTASLGAALAPYLAVHNPLLLLALNPWPRHLILVAPLVPVVPFVAVATARAMLSALLGYEAGKRYGARGLELFQERSERLGKVLTEVERVFRRASVPLLVIAPGPLMAALAGVSGMRRSVTWSALLVGHTGWVYLIYQLGDFLAPWTTPIMAFLQRNLLTTTLACAAIVLAYHLHAQRKRRKKLGR